jgi:hypothetical protein
MERMRELVQQSTSSSTELAAAAEQMSKLSRNLLSSMDRFALEEHSAESRKRDSARLAIGEPVSEQDAIPEYAGSAS